MNKSKEMALGGLMAALAVVFMCLGGMIPIMTYASPVMCIMLGGFLLRFLHRGGFVVWYITVSILTLLLCPDKEAAVIFGGLGYYPVIQTYLDRLPFRWLFKVLFFNTVILFLYWILIRIVGLSIILNDFEEMGIVMTIVTLVLGNLVFFLIDRLLYKVQKGKIRRKKG